MRRKLMFVQNSLRIYTSNIGRTACYRTTHPLKKQSQIYIKISLKTTEYYQGSENSRNQDPGKKEIKEGWVSSFAPCLWGLRGASSVAESSRLSSHWTGILGTIWEHRVRRWEKALVNSTHFHLRTTKAHTLGVGIRYNETNLHRN